MDALRGGIGRRPSGGKEERTSTKNALGRGGLGTGVTWQRGGKRSTHSSPRRNSAVTAKCSLERLDERTPPYSSASRTVPKVERLSVLCSANYPMTQKSVTPHSSLRREFVVETDLKRVVFESVCDTGLGLIPAASLDEEGDSSRGLAIVGGSDLHASAVDDGSKPACITGNARRTARGRRSGCQHGE